MNILQIGSYLYPDTPGGAEISAQNVALALTEAGHRIVRLRWRASGRARVRGKIEKAGECQWTAATWRPYAPLETKRGLAKAVFYGMEIAAPLSFSAFQVLIDEEGIDAIIVHSVRGLGYDILRRISALNLPTILFLHDFALICLNKGMFRGGEACQTLCSECRFVARINSHALHSIDALSFIGASAQLVEKTRAALAIAGASFFNIPNPNRYNLKPRPRVASDTFVLGYVGRMERDKGVPDLLELADELHARHAIRFVLAGAGSLAPLVRRYADQRPWVDYRGFVQPEQIVDVYDAMDILAVPSLWAENFPGVLVQALGNGVPAVGFDIGGTPEIIQHGRTGIVVPVGDFAAMREAISELINNPGRYAAMSCASIQAAEGLSPERLRARVVEAIEGTVKRWKVVG